MEEEDLEVVGGKYQIIRNIGNGSFGDIYLAIDMESREKIALKIECSHRRHQHLLHEYEVYQMLSGGDGIPNTYYYGNEENFNFLVMDLLGPSLEDLFNFCSRHFSMNTVLMLADQMIDRLEFIHSKFYIHRDLKPENFLIGSGEDCFKLFLIDFGLAKAYRNLKTMKHIGFEYEKSLIGTVRYSSINNHLGIEQSRRDDMESVGYVIIYFNNGSLPWQGIKAMSKKQKYERIAEKKASTAISILCKDLPEAFALYLIYCRALQFEELPDYKYLTQLFRTFAHSIGYKYDYNYDWTILRQKLNKTQPNSDLMSEPETKSEEEKPNKVGKLSMFAD